MQQKLCRGWHQAPPEQKSNTLSQHPSYTVGARQDLSTN